MKSYGFTVAHGYKILKGYLDAENIMDAETKILNEEWYDIIDEYDSEELVEGYEVIEIWDT